MGEKWHRFSYFWLPLPHCDFHFKHFNISLSKNKLIVYLNSSCQDCSIQKNRKKVPWFFTNLYGRISHQLKKVVDDKTSTNLHFVSFVNSL